MKVDIVLLTALTEEYIAINSAVSLLATSQESYVGLCNKEYAVFSMPTHHGPIRVALPQPLGMGQLSAAISTNEMLLDLAPSITVLVGIAGCMGSKSRFKLGDIAVSHQIHDYELRKESDGIVKPRWRTYLSDDQLVRRIEPEVREIPWAVPLIPLRPDKLGEPSRVHFGNFLSGNSVLADDKVRDELITISPDPVIAVEMEAAGIAAVLARDGAHNHFVTIKSFSDWAGADKSDRSSKKDVWHDYACRAAASVTAALLPTSLAAHATGLPFTPDAEHYFETKADVAVRCLLSSIPYCPEFVTKMCRTVFGAAIEEVKQISKMGGGVSDPRFWVRGHTYRGAVSSGSHFLLRAEPMFSTATRIYAVSLGHVSQFWIDPNTTNHVKAYIASHSFGEDHKQDVMRLFVPSDPDEAHQYARRLDLHAERFPNTFICSKEHYEALVERRFGATAGTIDRLMKSDYAVLFQRVGEGEKRYVADLDGVWLRMSEAIDNVNANLSYDNVVQWFNDISELSPGGMWGDLPILKWKPGLWKSKQRWAEMLQLMYEKRTADVFHFMGLSNASDEQVESFRQVTASMKLDMLEQRPGARYSLVKRHRIKNVRLTRIIDREDASVRDGITGGKLRYGNHLIPGTMVIIRAPDDDALKAFMEDSEHSRIRLDLLLQIAKVNNEVAKILDQHNISSVDEFKSAVDTHAIVLEKVEEAAGVVRFDLRDDELIKEIVQVEPPAL